ncbi:homocysteine-responsive endoplasmic reticulum-resident ubiquitin-like domain member 1 protein isoform X2 [Sinocyclocheilus rhinocerous]|uniref:homocysteine-responsive endoplasmic reticulum-resident ubiquitin-like domain member 1 protein isoform X2 n=1 Tax=Sinocyclocheilus rhinocerous TaxID=307959 RepID=UPI0007B7D886|nr:PREDICTED: homocysteine-responsive endoplasmic reticulum-resident ubiquitin-like domain member 1 protein isoform X2 [Sinocyclocheilus rhinocerous]
MNLHSAEKDQRLIYSGKLLQDNLFLRDVFSKVPSETKPTLHLVCAVKPQPAAQLGARPKVTSTQQQSSQPSPLTASQSSESSGPSMTSVPSTDGLRQRGHAAWPGTSMPVTAAMAHPAFPTYSLYRPQQLLWLQQMYARQYTSVPSTDGLRQRGHAAWPGTSMPVTAAMAHPAFPTYSLYSPQQLLWLQQMYAHAYMQYHAAMEAAASTPMAAPASSLPVGPHQAAVPAALPNQGPINDLPANQNAPAPAFINPEGANQNLRMNAQGGPVMEDEEDMNRDWLDWVYTASRLGVFLSIVYFYSSLSRFILVMSSLVIMYLHTAGWFPFRRRPQARPHNQPAPEVIQNQQNQNEDRHPGPVPPPAEVEGAGVVELAMTAVPVPPVRPPILWTAWVFFKAFFASLIPEAPQGVAN